MMLTLFLTKLVLPVKDGHSVQCSGEVPPEDVAEEFGTVSIGGMKWYSKLDIHEVLIPTLHFSRKVRGQLVLGAGIFGEIQ